MENGKTYKRIGAIIKMDAILNAVSSSHVPLTGAQVAEHTSIPRDTVMTYLYTLMDCGYVAQAGENFVLGLRMATFWARAKARMEAEVMRLLEQISELLGGR